MKNLEIKAHCKNQKKAESIVRSMKAEYSCSCFQRDTYYKVSRGNLKLRETNSGEDVLIFYKRRKTASPKLCDYALFNVEKSNELKMFLKEAFGEAVVVEKIRKIYLYKNVRIHLDNVKELGEFIEFEAVLSEVNGHKESQETVQFLMEKLSIEKEDLIKGSYSGMLMQLKKSGKK